MPSAPSLPFSQFPRFLTLKSFSISPLPFYQFFPFTPTPMALDQVLAALPWDSYFHSLPVYPVCMFLFINSFSVNYRVLLTRQMVLNTINKQGMRWYLSLLFKAAIWSSHPWEPPWLVHDMPWPPLVFGSYLCFLPLRRSLHLTLLKSFPNFKVPQIISFRLSPFLFPTGYHCPL